MSGTLLLGSSGIVHAQDKQETKIARIGDIFISKFKTETFKTDFSFYHLTGPETVIEVPDKSSHSNLVLHADDITVDKANVRGGAIVDLKGRIRYTLTQTTPAGDRVVKGTAGKANYRQADHRIELTGGAQTSLTDPQLIGPAVLRSGKISIDVGAAPYYYTFEGDDSVNDLKFTPRRAPKKGKKPEDRSDIGLVHIHHYDKGEFQAGKVARFEGANTVTDLNEIPGKTQAQLKAALMVGSFEENSGELVRTEATGNARYRISRMVPKREGKGETRQEVTGTCRKFIYDVVPGRMELKDDIEATLTDPDALLIPAKLSASNVVVTANPTRYEITGAPNHARLELTPRPAKPKAPAPNKADGAKGEVIKPLEAKPADAANQEAGKPKQPAPPPFMLGTITLTGFEKGTYEPGKKIAMNGENLTVVSKDLLSKSESNLHAQVVTADIADDGSIANAEATGKVRYFIQRPGSDGKSLQSIKGTAKTAGYTVAAATPGSEKAGVFKVQGPFEAEVTDPENLEGPGHATGKEKDSFSFNLVTREFDFDSPDQSIILVFVPKEKPPAATDSDKKTEKKPTKKP